MTACVLLSAGESRRFGSPKALAPVGEKPAIVHLQQSLLTANLDEVIVVLGAHAEAITPHVFNHKRVRIVHNKDYKLGQTSSFQRGVSAVSDGAHGIMLMPVDCPLVAAATLAMLAQEFRNTRPDILIPTYSGRRGHPPVFNVRLIPAILRLQAAEGVHTLFEQTSPCEVQVNDSGILRTFNTPEEYSGLFQN